MTRSGRACCSPARAAADVRDEFAIAPGPVHRSGMVLIPGGTFRHGRRRRGRLSLRRRGPGSRGALASFLIDATRSATASSPRSSTATGYVTDAERFGWSFVFYALLDGKARRPAPGRRPGRAVVAAASTGASWRAPHGAGSDADDHADHPVVHVSCRDAKSLCGVGAASGCRPKPNGRRRRAAACEQARYPWGDELRPGGRASLQHLAGPLSRGQHRRRRLSRHRARRRVCCPTAMGCTTSSGNVWEWCADGGARLARQRRADRPRAGR